MGVHRQQQARLRWLLESQLVAAKAVARSLTPDALLRAELNVDPSDAARWEAARRAYLDQLWKEAGISITLPEPRRPVIHVSEATHGPVLGLADAPISVVEFCAFSSAECREAWTHLREAAKRLGPRIRIAHRDYPPLGTSASLTAAIAARCAHRQGKFWPYHDRLYDSQDRLADVPGLRALAREIGLDSAAFDRCLDNRETALDIAGDAWEGTRVGLSQLPALFVNGTYVPGVLPVDDLIRTLAGLAIQ